MKEKTSELNLMDKIKELELLKQIFKDLTSSLNLNEVLIRILDKMKLLVKAEGVSLFRLDKDKNEFYFAAADNENLNNAKLKSLRISKDKGIVGWTTKNKKAIIVNNPSEDKRFNQDVDKKTGFVTTSILAVPVIFKNEVLAIIEAVNKKNKTGDFNAEDLNRLTQLSECAAVSIRNAELFQQVHKMSITDPLTGLSNTRHFYSRFEKILSYCKKNSKKFAVIILDMDNFKEVVDTYGHQAGSRTLIEIGKVIRKTTPLENLICRFGGDEFIILFSYSNQGEVKNLVESIIENIQKLETIDDGKVDVSKVTASVGISLFPKDAKSSQKLFYLADKAMYKVKNSTKNNYVFNS